jgi:DNA/RNA endonuclease YhcR with UshA esterase domain
MKPNDPAPEKARPLPGHETQSDEMACPKCGRFVGAAVKCPYCGAKVEKRMSLLALRWAAILLSTVGLVLLWLMAKTREPERIQIGDIEATMNFGVVRLSGEVRGDPRPFKNGNGMSFTVSDGSGELRVFVDMAQRKAMQEAGLVPRRGDGIDFVAQLQSSASGNSARIRSLDPKSFALTRDGAPAGTAGATGTGSPDSAPAAAPATTAKDFGPAVPFSAVDESKVGQTIVLEGTVVAIQEPAAGSKRPYVVTLTNGVEGVDVKVWSDEYARIADPASLTGTPVRVRAAVKLYQNKVDLQLRKGSDLQRAVRPEPKRRAPVPVATAAAGKLGDWVTVVGALSEPADLDGKGTSYKLTDDSGTIQVVFWNSTVPPDVQKKAAAAARASVNGKVKEYQGTRQVVPSKADGVEALERE